MFLYPYGQAKDPIAAAGNTERLRFTGHERDLNGPNESDDLDYMHARFCSPMTGRFLSVDPKLRRRAIAMPHRWNRYSYGGSNPLRFVDPDGREEKPATPSILDALRNALRSVAANQNTLQDTVYIDGEFRQAGLSPDDLVMIAGTAVAIATFDDIFGASTPTENGEQIRRQEGGVDEATRQFDAAVDPDSVEDKGNGVRVGKDRKTGKTIILRQESSDAKAEVTLEEQRTTEHGRMRSRKVRFDPLDEEEPQPE